MKIIEPSYEIWTKISDGGMDELKFIERVARVCYKSEGLITEELDSAEKLLKFLIQNEHDAMLEHQGLTVKFTCDRGISHEIVRHRMASYAQESTRYCNYEKDKFGNEITVIKPLFYQQTNGEKGEDQYDNEYWKFDLWLQSCQQAEKTYLDLLNRGSTPQEARSVLPNSLKTELVMTANYREWRHFFKLRTSPAAHPQMREITIPLLKELQSRIPIIFDDIEVAA